jgi:hypothetical protein
MPDRRLLFTAPAVTSGTIGKSVDLRRVGI